MADGRASGSNCDDEAVTLVIAHRGASRAEPENTLAAFRRAGAFGADGVELDARLTADDHLVVHHDAALPDGRVIRSTRAADLPAHVPRLGDALDACDGMFVNIEIKNIRGEPDHDPGDQLAHRVIDLLVERGDSGRWLVSSFRLATVDVVRDRLRGARTAWLVGAAPPDAIERAARHGHDAIHPSVDHVTADAVRHAHRLGIAVNVWTCNDADRMAELMRWGVDGICTDVPDVALAVRRR